MIKRNFSLSRIISHSVCGISFRGVFNVIAGTFGNTAKNELYGISRICLEYYVISGIPNEPIYLIVVFLNYPFSGYVSKLKRHRIDLNLKLVGGISLLEANGCIRYNYLEVVNTVIRNVLNFY